MTFDEERYIIEYANKAFGYLNGRVNNIPAKLNIRTKFTKDILANNIFNIVNLYIWNIADNANLDEIKRSIVINLVHELSHIGQDIDYVRYNNDNSYKLLKENENNFNTYSYIQYNLIILCNELDVLFDISDIANNYNYYRNYNTYMRYSREEYYKQCLKILLSNDVNKDISMLIDKLFECKKFSITINCKPIIIVDNWLIELVDKSSFQELLDLYNNTNMSVSHSKLYSNIPTLISKINFHHCFENNGM